MALRGITAILLTDGCSTPATTPEQEEHQGGVEMYEQANIGQTRVSANDVRWQNWTGRQIFKYRYADPKKARGQERLAQR
jgi:hypothetical protein